MIKFIEKILGIPEHGDSPRADLMLPNAVLIIGVIVFLLGLIIGVLSIIDLDFTRLCAALLIIVFGIMTIIWWKNSTITIVTSNTIEVKNMFGKIKTFKLDDISGFDRSYNYIDIYVGKDKFKIESTALMTQRLRTLLNKALNKDVFK